MDHMLFMRSVLVGMFVVRSCVCFWDREASGSSTAQLTLCDVTKSDAKVTSGPDSVFTKSPQVGTVAWCGVRLGCACQGRSVGASPHGEVFLWGLWG